MTGGEDDVVTLEWRSATNSFYAIQYSEDLRFGFSDLFTHIAADPPTHRYVFTNTIPVSPLHYRVIQED